VANENKDQDIHVQQSTPVLSRKGMTPCFVVEGVERFSQANETHSDSKAQILRPCCTEERIIATSRDHLIDASTCMRKVIVHHFNKYQIVVTAHLSI